MSAAELTTDLSLTALDLVLLAIILVSAIYGIVRGLIRELLSLLSWAVSIWLAFKYAPDFSPLLEPYLDSPQLQYLIALAAIFVVSLLLFSLCAIVLAKLLSLVGIAGTDRSLGAVFGIIRGIAIGLILVFLLRLTPADEQDWFTSSSLVPYFDPIFAWMDQRGFSPTAPALEIPLVPTN